jgi:hypothetical protein
MRNSEPNKAIGCKILNPNKGMGFYFEPLSFDGIQIHNLCWRRCKILNPNKGKGFYFEPLSFDGIQIHNLCWRSTYLQ